MTRFQRVIVIVTAATVMLQLLLYEYGRPPLGTPPVILGVHVLVTVIAGGVAWVMGWRSLATLLAIVILAFAGVKQWTAREPQRAEMRAACTEAQQFDNGELEWNRWLVSGKILISPDSGRWAVGGLSRLTFVRTPFRWHAECLSYPFLLLFSTTVPSLNGCRTLRAKWFEALAW